uniref:Uncharacterized protein n=1 Tax=Lygus hesperus TaxID=30085 RepID=A0A146LXZ0_LYGHE
MLGCGNDSESYAINFMKKTKNFEIQYSRRGTKSRMFIMAQMGSSEVSSIYIFITVCDVQEEILFVVLLIERTHGGRCRRNDVVDKEEQSVIRAQLNSLADEEVKLAYSEVRRHQIFLLVKIADPCFGSLLYDHGDSISIFPSDFLAFCLPFLERVLFFVLKLHVERLNFRKLLNEMKPREELEEDSTKT